jgi:hypothetical protein
MKEYSEEADFGAYRAASDWNRFHSDLGERDEGTICLLSSIK